MSDLIAEPPPAHATGTQSTARIAVASFMGTAIEFYDFYIYGTAAALVFSGAFFPELSDVAGTLAALSTFAVAFVARPLGSALFGHFGDRVGRKSMLIASLLTMGLATFAIGLLPGYSSIGVLAPLLLVLLRFAQGLGLGGEWGGAALIATEHAPPGKRGLFGAFPQLGPSIGYIAASGIFLALTLTMSESTFESWGWRVPFLISIVLVGVGLWVRLQIAETPAFARVMDQQERAKVPLFVLLRQSWLPVLLGALAMAIAYSLFYTATTFSLTYATADERGFSRPEAIGATLVGAAFMALGTWVSARLSDRFGRRPTLIAAVVMSVLFAPAMFPLIDTGAYAGLLLAICGALWCMGAVYGPMGAFLPELFPATTRYSGSALAYSLGGVIGGAAAPLLAARLAADYGAGAVGLYLMGVAVVSLLAVLALPETRDRDLVAQ
ncbi:metabolite-proton symporter [Knoellia remsis]|uniref:Putative proline/betaine transporter n=1 Tax=Knoellia remsis TaxID=407159 RepID=A0A2T0UXD4_9MICO|nr:MFS transporter [Knoellia remsis]PRY62590.1 metabolite-proton symporter [Knoellia remsis]